MAAGRHRKGVGNPQKGKCWLGKGGKAYVGSVQCLRQVGRKTTPATGTPHPLHPLAESEARGSPTMPPPHFQPLVLGDPPPSFFWESVSLVTHEWTSYVHPASQKLL